jgi:hypothetical protein
MHTTAIRFALRYSFRLGSDRLGYYLTDGKGAIVDRPFWGEHTAAAAIRMMRRNLRHMVAQTRAA